jgi:2-aminoadipate transaminase
MDLARRRRLPIIEDDCYADLCFEATCPPALLSIDPALVTYVGSFSKILAPGFRLGFFVAPDSMRDRLLSLKNDGGTSQVAAMIAAAYLRDRLDDHVQRVAASVRRRSDLLLHALERHLAGSGASWRPPTGGFFCWLRLPPDVDPSLLAAAAARRGLRYGRGRDFEPAFQDVPFARLCFAAIDPADIDPGVRTLAACIEEAAGPR